MNRDSFFDTEQPSAEMPHAGQVALIRWASLVAVVACLAALIL